MDSVGPSVASKTPAPSRLRRLLGLFVRSGGAEKGAQERSPEWQNEHRRYAYARWLLRVLVASVGLHGFWVIVLVWAGFAAGSRPVLQVTARPSLAAEASEMFQASSDLKESDVMLFLSSTLPPMHFIDDRGAPHLPLVQGQLAPEIYVQAKREAAEVTEVAKKNLLIRSFVLGNISEIDADLRRGRVSAYVSGYLTTILQASGKHVVLPYRAEVRMAVAPPSELNPFRFTLIRHEWKFGRDALEWDGKRRTGANRAADQRN